eukprot:7579911-Pyramimonas_sp.AAC.1
MKQTAAASCPALHGESYRLDHRVELAHKRQHETERATLAVDSGLRGTKGHRSSRLKVAIA